MKGNNYLADSYSSPFLTAKGPAKIAGLSKHTLATKHPKTNPAYVSSLPSCNYTSLLLRSFNLSVLNFIFPILIAEAVLYTINHRDKKHPPQTNPQHTHRGACI